VSEHAGRSQDGRHGLQVGAEAVRRLLGTVQHCTRSNWTLDRHSVQLQVRADPVGQVGLLAEQLGLAGDCVFGSAVGEFFLKKGGKDRVTRQHCLQHPRSRVDFVNGDLSVHLRVRGLLFGLVEDNSVSRHSLRSVGNIVLCGIGNDEGRW